MRVRVSVRVRVRARFYIVSYYDLQCFGLHHSGTKHTKDTLNTHVAHVLFILISIKQS